MGTKIYLGDAASFHEWEFRTRLRIAGKTGDQYVEATSKVCDGLRGDASVAAQEVGFDVLCEIVNSVLWCRLQPVMNTILTEMLTPSSFNIHVFISEKVKDEQRAKAKMGSNVLTIQTLERQPHWQRKIWSKSLSRELYFR